MSLASWHTLPEQGTLKKLSWYLGLTFRAYSNFVFFANHHDVMASDFHNSVKQGIEALESCFEYRSKRSCVYDVEVIKTGNANQVPLQMGISVDLLYF